MLRHVVEHRPVGHPGLPDLAPQVRLDARAVPRRKLPGAPVDDLRAALVVAQRQPVLRALGIAVQDDRGIGEPREVVEVDPPRPHQLIDQRHHEQAIGPRRDAEPIVRDRVVAAADRIDADDLRAPRLDLADAHLDRVAVVVLGDTEDQEHLGALPVRRAELPERPAHRVDATGGHVDRAEAAVRGIVRRAETLGPETRETLALVAPGEERELLGRGLAQRRQPLRGDGQRLVPADLFEVARPARPHPLHRCPQPGRRIVLHDARRTLGTEHAPVHRMVAVAFDIGDFPVLHVHVDPAPAGAHVAGGLADLVRHLGAQIQAGLRHPVSGVPRACKRLHRSFCTDYPPAARSLSASRAIWRSSSAGTT